MRDGSGLSRHDYVSPRTLVTVLDAMRRHPDFKVFYDALPIAGVDGTIDKRMRGTAAQGNVHAKTGYVDKARSLSGYVTTADGTHADLQHAVQQLRRADDARWIAFRTRWPCASPRCA